MSRKRRSEKIAELVTPTRERPRAAKVVERMVSALCPVCGRTIQENRAVKIGGVTIDRVGYFDSIEWDENKPFGVAYTVAGRESFREWQHIGPEEAPELFQAVKRRLVQALREWLKKGWLSKEEVEVG